MRFGFLICGLIVSASTYTSAQSLRICNGIYTDRPCGEVEVVPSPHPQDPGLDTRRAAQERAKKQSALHALTTRLVKERRRLGIELDISEAEEVCSSPTSTIDECRTVVGRLDDKLEERVVARLAVERQRTPNPSESPSHSLNGTQQNQSNVVVVQPAPTRRYIIINDEPLHVPPHVRHPPQVYIPPHQHIPPHPSAPPASAGAAEKGSAFSRDPRK